jgi:YD repeat-containing protein
MHADQAQYFYDELGRLVGVVDGSGDAAVYVYDEVGNLLQIDRIPVLALTIVVGRSDL